MGDALLLAAPLEQSDFLRGTEQRLPLGEFISVASALGRELYWEEDTWANYLYINTKY